MPGGPQPGSGRRPVEERDWVRSKPIRAMFRPPEFADLQAIAQAWNVPVATVVWAVVHDQLATWQKRAPEFGESGLAIAAAVAVLRLKPDRDQSGGSGTGSPERPEAPR